MQPQDITHKLIKKSSYNFEESKQEQSQQAIPINISSNISEPHAEQQNLLDLAGQHQQADHFLNYHQFLEDRVIEIEGPQLVVENVVKSYKLYIVKSRKLTSAKYDTIVKRRFSDFQYLSQQLLTHYGGCILPKLPEKNFWVNMNMEGEQYIQWRRKKLKKYLQTLLGHVEVRMSEELKEFLFFDDVKFSQSKGDFFSALKAEDKLKNAAISAYSYGKDLFSKYVLQKNQSEIEERVKIAIPTIEDLTLMEYENDVQTLLKSTTMLKNMVANTVTQIKLSSVLFKFEPLDNPDFLLQQFQELCQYIESCHEALQRRFSARLEMQNLSLEYEKLQKKVKLNPRSKQMDVVRSKLAKSSEICENWTKSLLKDLDNSVKLGKSMVSNFLNEYKKTKSNFYNS